MCTVHFAKSLDSVVCSSQIPRLKTKALPPLDGMIFRNGGLSKTDVSFMVMEAMIDGFEFRFFGNLLWVSFGLS